MTGLEFLRRHHKLSQQELSYRAKVPQPFISAIEVGRRNPPPAELRALAQAMGFYGNPALLLSGTPDPEEVLR
jgi:transcriptional regulator with XRE-family HTH domain